MNNQRKVIVDIATSADVYIARTDGDLEWLTARPAPAGFYGIDVFTQSIDTKLLGRKTYEASLRMGEKFGSRIERSSSCVIRVQKMLRQPSNLQTRRLVCS